MLLMLLYIKGKLGFIIQLLINTFDYKASQLTGQFADSFTTIKWLSTLENVIYIIRRSKLITTYR
jgi:hypothetical protein